MLVLKGKQLFVPQFRSLLNVDGAATAAAEAETGAEIDPEVQRMATMMKVSYEEARGMANGVGVPSVEGKKHT
jgi:hypothetical protein